MPALSSLHLDSCNLTRLLVEVPPLTVLSIDELREEYGVSDLSSKFEVSPVSGAGALQFVIELSVAAEARPRAARQAWLTVQITLKGLFSLPNDTPEEDVQALVPLNGLAILYGIARGMVAQATGPTLHGALWLPAVSFVDLIGEQAQQAEHEAAKARKASVRKTTPRKSATPKRRKPESR